MSLFTIILLVLLGTVCLFLEFFIIPGVTVAGVAGLILVGTGIYFAYSSFDSPLTGHLISGGTLLLLVITFYIAFKSGTWKKVALSSQISSKAGEAAEVNVQPGATGMTVSRLAPMGKIDIDGQYYEVKAENTFIDQNIQVIVTKVFKNQIIVKPKI